MSNIKSIIRSFGGYLPSNIVKNDDLPQHLDTSDEWIRTRTGILQRHIVAGDEKTSDLAAQAAKIALQNADFSPLDIDMIIVATTSPDMTFPSTACFVQEKLGATKAFAFDIQAVCSGFIYAMETADAYIVSGKVRNVLVIGAESMSKIVDWADRSTCVLFGDGAGAVILSAEQNGDRGILASNLYSDGNFWGSLYTESISSNVYPNSILKMKGKDIYKHALEKMSGVLVETISDSGKSFNEIDYFVPHQANVRILEAIADKLNIPNEKLVVTVGEHANTSAATIPLALYEMYTRGLTKPGTTLAMTALGGGLTWGAMVIKL